MPDTDSFEWVKKGFLGHKTEMKIHIEDYCSQHYSDDWKWKICGSDVDQDGPIEFFAKEAVEVDKVEINAAHGINSEDSQIGGASGFNKIKVSLGVYDSPGGTYCAGRSYQVPKYELINCKEISTLKYDNKGIEVKLVKLLASTENTCGFVDSYGVSEKINHATCDESDKLFKFNVFGSDLN